MALKGSAVIELTNVKTGETERYEEHNLVTKALEYLHTPIGQLKAPCDCTILSEPVYPALLGGILLLDSTLEEDDAIVTLPTNVEVVGCACYGQTNTTTSPKRGSYNESESYLTASSAERSMKFVYDFATNQANGNINCISLTNWKSGWNGFGGNDGLDDNISNGIYSSTLGSGSSTRYWFSNNKSIAKLLLIDPEEDVFYHVSSLTTTSVTIAKRRANIHQKSVFMDMYSSHDLVESIQIPLPTSLTGTNTYICNYDTRNDVAYIMVAPSSSSVAKSEAFHVVEVDLNARTATVYTRTNPLSSALSFYAYTVACFDGSLYYAGSTDTYVRKIPLDGSAYKSIYLAGNSMYQSSYAGYCFAFANDRLYFPIRKSSSSSTADTEVGVVNPDTNNFSVTGAVDTPESLYSGFSKCVPIKGNPLYFYYYTGSSYTNSTSSSYGRLWLDTHYLATINNLSRTIEKTSDKTMKITYTIQEV